MNITRITATIAAVAVAAMLAGCGGSTTVDARDLDSVTAVEEQITSTVSAKMSALQLEGSPTVTCQPTSSTHLECIVELPLQPGMGEAVPQQASWEADVDPETGRFAAHSR